MFLEDTNFICLTTILNKFNSFLRYINFTLTIVWKLKLYKIIYTYKLNYHIIHIYQNVLI